MQLLLRPCSLRRTKDGRASDVRTLAAKGRPATYGTRTVALFSLRTSECPSSPAALPPEPTADKPVQFQLLHWEKRDPRRELSMW